MTLHPSSGHRRDLVSVSTEGWAATLYGTGATVRFGKGSIGTAPLGACNGGKGSGFGQDCNGSISNFSVPGRARLGTRRISVCVPIGGRRVCADTPYTVLSRSTKPGARPTASPVATTVQPSVTSNLGSLHDGRLNTTWESAAGHTTQQRIVLRLGNGSVYTLDDLFIDPASAAGTPSTADLRNFTISVSSAGSALTDFHQVLSDHCRQAPGLQHFTLPAGTSARYVELDAADNYGGPRLAVTELEVYGRLASSGMRVQAAHTHRLHLLQSPPLAHVQTIQSGLGVQPPNKSKEAGQVNMPLYDLYTLLTLAQQRAAIRFGDGTALFLNQRSQAELRTPNLTSVKSGSVDQIVAPGTNHVVQTDAISASAIGTDFIVSRLRAARGGFFTRVLVIEGAVLVRTPHGSVVVKTGQETTVVAGHAPTPPRSVAAISQLTAWTHNLPPPNLPENFALDANGGTIVSGP